MNGTATESLNSNLSRVSKDTGDILTVGSSSSNISVDTKAKVKLSDVNPYDNQNANVKPEIVDLNQPLVKGANATTYVSQEEANSKFSTNSEISKLSSTYGNSLVSSETKKDAAGHYYKEFRVNKDKNGDSHYYLYRINADNSMECVVGQTNYKDGTYTHINRDTKTWDSKKIDGDKTTVTKYKYENGKKGEVITQDTYENATLIKHVHTPEKNYFSKDKATNAFDTNSDITKLKENSNLKTSEMKQDADGHYYKEYRYTDANGGSHYYLYRLNGNNKMECVLAQTNNKDGSYTHINRDTHSYETKSINGKMATTTVYTFNGDKKGDIISRDTIDMTAPSIKKVATSDSTSKTSSATKGRTFNLSEQELRGLATVCVDEQGSDINAIKYEASLMANLADKSKYKNVADYVRKSGWFAHGKKYMNSPRSSVHGDAVSQKVIDAVRDVLVNGNRVTQANEHDCFSDISKIVDLDTGKTYTSRSAIKNRSNYKKGKTVIYNRYGSRYLFESFPGARSDPFGKIVTNKQISQIKAGQLDFYGSSNTASVKKNTTNASTSNSKYVNPSISKTDATNLISSSKTLTDLKSNTSGNWTDDGLKYDGQHYYQVFHCTDKNGNKHTYNIRLKNDKSTEVVISNIDNADGSYTHINSDAKTMETKNSWGTVDKYSYTNGKQGELLSRKSVGGGGNSIFYPTSDSEAKERLENNAAIKNKLKELGSNFKSSNGVQKDAAGHYYIQYTAASDNKGNSDIYTYRINGDNNIECVESKVTDKNGNYTYVNRDSNIKEVAKVNGSKITVSKYNLSSGKLISQNEGYKIHAQEVLGKGDATKVYSGVITNGGSSIASRLINEANKYIGNRYVWGGNSLTNGCDCSHYVNLLLKKLGIRVPYASTSEMVSTYTRHGFTNIGKNWANAKPGDIIVYKGHTGILGENGKLLEAQGRRAGITNNRSATKHKNLVAILRYNK